MTEIASDTQGIRGRALFKLIAYSAIGIFMFFVPVTIAGKSTIPLDHVATAVVTYAHPAALVFVCLLILYGAVSPFVSGSWNKSMTERVFSLLRLLGLVVTAMYLADMDRRHCSLRTCCRSCSKSWFFRSA